jgi:hypothetical protein
VTMYLAPCNPHMYIYISLSDSTVHVSAATRDGFALTMSISADFCICRPCLLTTPVGNGSIYIFTPSDNSAYTCSDPLTFGHPHTYNSQIFHPGRFQDGPTGTQMFRPPPSQLPEL